MAVAEVGKVFRNEIDTVRRVVFGQTKAACEVAIRELVAGWPEDSLPLLGRAIRAIQDVKP